MVREMGKIKMIKIRYVHVPIPQDQNVIIICKHIIINSISFPIYYELIPSRQEKKFFKVSGISILEDKKNTEMGIVPCHLTSHCPARNGPPSFLTSSGCFLGVSNCAFY